MQVRQIPINKNRMETTLHGSFEFPLAVYETTPSRNVMGFVDWHWHDELQFCAVTRGAVKFFVEEKRFITWAGQGIFIGGGRLHAARPSGGPESAYLCLNFAPRLLASFPGSACGAKYVEPFLRDSSLGCVFLDPAETWQRRVIDGVKRVAELCAAREFGFELAVTAEASLMWFELLKRRSALVPVGNARGSRAVQAVFGFIAAHFAEPLTMERIAGAAALSVGECCRMFRRVTGETVFSYLRTYRLARAAELLKTTAAPLDRIAESCGLCSASYLIKLFRERMGTTPHRYRREGA